MKRIAIAGFDHLHAVSYLEAFLSHPDVEVVGICDSGVNRDVAAGFAAAHDVAFAEGPSGYLSWDVDGIYIGAVPTRHREVVTTAAANGVHVMCDKPLATTIEDADAILAAVADAGTGLSVPLRPVFQVPVRTALDRLRSGELGEVQSIYAVKYGRLPTSAPGPMDASWFLDPAQAGFGGFADIGSHALDALCRLADSTPRYVYARIGAHLDPELPTDDLGTAHLEFHNGVHAVLSAGWANPDGSPRWLEVRFEVLTTTHAFTVSAPYRELVVVDGTGTRLIPWERSDLGGIVDDFVTVMSGGSPVVSGVDARTNMAVLEAAYRSAETGEREEVTT